MSEVFSVEESNLICVYKSERRETLIKDIQQSIPYLNDKEMIELSNKVLAKLEKITDDEFSEFAFESAE